MLTTILIAAGAMVQAYAAPATPPTGAPAATIAPVATQPAGRTLKDLPGTTIVYYDIAGKNGPAIEKSLKKILADPAKKDTVRLFTWDVSAQIMKATTGTVCKVQSAKSTLTAKVQLPRLAEQAKVPADVSTKWAAYVAGVENEAAANLWFISDRLRGAEQSLVGMPCDQANPAWDAKIETVKTELNAFIAQRAQAAAKPAGKVAKGDDVAG